MDFSQALDRKLEEVKRPPNLPIGHYTWQINKVPEQETFESSRTGDTFDRLTFQCVCVEAADDVDTDDLEDYGNVAGALNRKSFMFTQNEEEKASWDRSLFNLTRFLKHCGVDESLSVEQGINDIVGHQFIGELNHRPDPNDAEIIYAEIGRTAAV